MKSKQKQWEECLLAAKIIVANNRNEAPEGFDPKMTWVAAAVGVAGIAVSVGSTAASGGFSKKPAAGAGGASGASGFPTWKNIPNVTYNPQAGAQQFGSILPSLTQSANSITANNTKQREKISPGSGQQFGLANNALNGYLQGNVPQDVQDQVLRDSAEKVGGTNNPFTGGGVAGSNFQRNLGLTSLNLQQAGLSAAPQWQQLANSFVTNPLSVAPFAQQMSQQQYQYDALNSQINTENASSGYAAGVNSWAQPQVMAQQQQALNQAGTNQLLGGLNGVAQVAGSYFGHTNGSPVASTGYGGSGYSGQPVQYSGINQANIQDLSGGASNGQLPSGLPAFNMAAYNLGQG